MCMSSPENFTLFTEITATGSKNLHGIIYYFKIYNIIIIKIHNEDGSMLCFHFYLKDQSLICTYLLYYFYLQLEI